MDKLHIGYIWTSLATVALIFFSCEWLDCPLARLMARFQIGATLAKEPVGYPVMFNLAVGMTLFGLAYSFFCAIRGKAIPKPILAAMLAGLAVTWSWKLEEKVLKPVFGRANPSTYLQNGDAGFHWFHGTVGFASFPSGHMEQATAILSVLWIFYPLGRVAYAVAAVLLGFALMLGQWHFLSDVIAGAFVGTAAGLLTVQAWKVIEGLSRDLLKRD